MDSSMPMNETTEKTTKANMTLKTTPMTITRKRSHRFLLGKNPGSSRAFALSQLALELDEAAEEDPAELPEVVLSLPLVDLGAEAYREGFYRESEDPAREVVAELVDDDEHAKDEKEHDCREDEVEGRGQEATLLSGSPARPPLSLFRRRGALPRLSEAGRARSFRGPSLSSSGWRRILSGPR